MLSILFVLSETVATVTLCAPPTVTHIRRWVVDTVPVVGQRMQFGDNYLNDGHLPPEIPLIDGRENFSSVSHRSLAVSFEVPNWSSPRLAVAKAWIDRVLCHRWLLVLRVWWQVRRRHQMTVVLACDYYLENKFWLIDWLTRRTRRRPRGLPSAVCGRDVRTADTSACGRQSARILAPQKCSALGKLTCWAQWADAIV